MKRWMACLATLTLISVGLGRADAEVIYSNGTTIDANSSAQIGQGQGQGVSSDSFTLTSAATVASVEAAFQGQSGGTPASVSWAIGNEAFGTEEGSGSASLTNVSTGVYGGDGLIYDSTFSVTTPVLAAGTYWLTLSNGLDNESQGLDWNDSSDGSSSAYVKFSGSNYSSPSEYFQLFGTTAAAVPEPASLAMLGLGLAAAAGYAWRARTRANLLS